MVEDGRPISRMSPSTCRKIRYNRRSDTLAIMPGRRTSSTTAGQRLRTEFWNPTGGWGSGVVDDSFLLLINAHHQKVTFSIPDAAYGAAWEVVVDTADPLLAHPRRRPLGPGDRQRLLGRSMRVLRRTH